MKAASASPLSCIDASSAKPGLRALCAAPWGGIVSAALALAAGLALRLWMLAKFPQVNGDTTVYGDLAKNLLLHGQFAITDGSGVIHPTLIRLPGYPLFLAACFRLFGIGNYTAVAHLQIAMELIGCLLLADVARMILTDQQAAGTPPFSRSLRKGWESKGWTAAAHITLWLAVLCPFTAVYAVAPLTETPTLFAVALALWSVARFQKRVCWVHALLFTFAVTLAALFRPDGALLAIALAPAMVFALFRKGTAIQTKQGRSLLIPASPIAMALVCLLLALAPFALWTARNYRVFHVLQPLAPRYANDPGEDPNPGFQRWVKSWCLDFASTYAIYWNVPGSALDVSKLPARAFDSPRQYAATAQLAADYNDNGQDLSPALDARFAQLAAERERAHPLRSFVLLPLGRVADMWLRPRVENLNIDLDWWVYAHHHSETIFSWEYAAINALYLLLGFAGLFLKPRLWQSMLAYFALRSALLATVEAPEARYTLECFPMLFALGGIAASVALQNAASLVLKLRIQAGKPNC